MSKSVRIVITLGIGIIVVAVPTLVLHAQRARDRAALAAYKAELRARGEKLTAQELGYPRPAESSSNLNLLIAGVNRIAAAHFEPGSLDLMHFVSPGRAEVAWAQPQLQVISAGTGQSNATTWEAVSAQFEKAAAALQDIRDAVKVPPRYFFNDLTNFANQAKAPFMDLHKAAQWLMGDAITAFHVGQSERAREDVHALARLSQFHREDLRLVSQMIRTAIAGLGLAVTWEALQAQGWSEEHLAALQKDWEAVDLADVFEMGMIGNRAYGEAAITHLRAISPQQRRIFFNSAPYFGHNVGANTSTRRSVEDYLSEFVVIPLWAANSEADEMMFLQVHQDLLDDFRSRRNGTPTVEINRKFGANMEKLPAAIANPLRRHRHLFSAIFMPNYIRGWSVSNRNETQRRLTIAAIALERCRLRNGKLPASLDALVPEFLSVIPIDPMCEKPLRYRLNSDAGFTLYSVGEDGRDDGGDPTSGGVTNKFGLWEGKDAVWPAAVR